MSRFWRIRLAAGVSAAALLVLSCAAPSEAPPPAVDVPRAAPSPIALRALALGVAPLAVDPGGGPRMLQAVAPRPAPAGASVDEAARAHLAALAPLWVERGPTADAAITATRALRGGPSLVLLDQRVDGVEVYQGGLRVLLDRDRSLLAISGTVRPAAVRSKRFVRSAQDALAAALAAEYRIAIPPATVAAIARRADYVHLAAPPRTDLLVGDARAKPVYVAAGGALTAAWFVELFATRAPGAGDDALRYLIADDSGAALERVDLRADETFIYRVYADSTGERRPYDGPHADYSPHPAGAPDGSFPAYVSSNLVAMEAFNEPRDPWLPADAVDTHGNNIDAYTDRDNDNTVAGGFRAETSSPGVFDHRYDLAAAPMSSDAQAKAAIVNIFYIVNWLHDWYYDSGFTEATGNAQTDNYGRGGVAGDPVQAQAQDAALATAGEQRNNANMSTPADGLSPRMQMYLWSGKLLEARLSVQPANLSPPVNTASFGAIEFDVTAPVVLADDGSTEVPPGSTGTGRTTDACQPVLNAAGRIVLVDGFNCTYKLKAKNAQDGGAVGIIVGSSRPAAPVLGNDATVLAGLTLGILSIGKPDADALRAVLASGQTATLRRASEVERDGDLDATVVAHEWGHYFHHRLSDCAGTLQCRAMSEGWADFVALHLAIRRGDDPGATYGQGMYAASGHPNSAYFGTRRYPYSVDRTRNDLSFRHIQRGVALSTAAPINPRWATYDDNAEPHMAGEVWASMLWETYVALLRRHPYDEARRRMSDYAVAGLQMMPPNATYTEARDGLLAATAAIDRDDMREVAEAFARRGAGTCAAAPPRESADLVGVVEHGEVTGRLALGAPTLVDDRVSCDHDGYLDAGELGTLRIPVVNSGPEPLTGITVTATSSTEGVVVGEAAVVAELAPFARAEVAIPVTAGLDVAVDGSVAIAVHATAGNDCSAAPLELAHGDRLGIDEVVASRIDPVEARMTTWIVTGDGGDAWGRPVDGASGHLWRGVDLGTTSDTQLVSPPLDLGTAEPFTVTLSHRYAFEAGATDLFDGGVIEITTDGGTTWRDVTELGVTVPYGGTLAAGTSTNPLAGRRAFTNQSAAWPARETLTLDFAPANLAGQIVQLRFRIGTDQSVGRDGWDLDDIAVTGTVNTPFAIVVPEGPTCQAAPTVDAGADQAVLAGTLVHLEAAAVDDNGDDLAFAWTQIDGPAVTLDGAATRAATFTAPEVTAETALVFRVDVSDPFHTTSDTVTVRVVLPPPPPPDAGVPDAGAPDAGAPDAGAPDAAVDAGLPDAPPSGEDAAPADAPPPDAGQPPPPPPPPPEEDGCACRSSSHPSSAWLFALVAVGLRRRRRPRR